VSGTVNGDNHSDEIDYKRISTDRIHSQVNELDSEACTESLRDIGALAVGTDACVDNQQDIYYRAVHSLIYSVNACHSPIKPHGFVRNTASSVPGQAGLGTILW